mmetsp:Transcript_110747/g.309491  ORF Transcript_110747/g.309491 Transcript_110747/m.309491 type:complete len:108 (+) Transcript_110747:627-950(+)
MQVKCLELLLKCGRHRTIFVFPTICQFDEFRATFSESCSYFLVASLLFVRDVGFWDLYCIHSDSTLCRFLSDFEASFLSWKNHIGSWYERKVKASKLSDRFFEHSHV